MRANSLLACASALVVGLVSTSANAVALGRYELQNATGLCQAALPNFDGQIRKRPTAISNEGTAITFVSCSPIGDPARTTDRVLVKLFNRNTASSTVNCVLVNGTIDGRTFFPKSVVILAGSAGTIEWTKAGDNGGLGFDVPNVQCSFLPGVELDFYEREFKESVGSPA